MQSYAHSSGWAWSPTVDTVHCTFRLPALYIPNQSFNVICDSEGPHTPKASIALGHVTALLLLMLAEIHFYIVLLMLQDGSKGQLQGCCHGS